MASTATGMCTRFETVQAFRPLEATGWISDLERTAECLLPEGSLNFHDEILGDGRVVNIPDLNELGNVIHRPESLGCASSLGPLAVEAAEKAPGSFSRPLSLKLNKLAVIEAPRGLERRQRQVMVAVIKQEEKIKAEKKAITKFINRSSDRHLHWRDHFVAVDLATVKKGYTLGKSNRERMAAHLPNRIIAEPGRIEPITLELR